MILNSSHIRGEKEARKIEAIAVVAAGCGGAMYEELANELLDKPSKGKREGILHN